ncbi:MAG: SCO family protein [Oscillochloris sp.]|nr:SCO family protein [Oscillochloris sp.]
MQLVTAQQHQDVPRRALRRKVVLGLAYGIPIIIAALIIWFAVARPVKVVPRIRQMPTYSLVDQTGTRLTDGDLRGRTVFISFAQSRCGAACDEQFAGLQALRDSIRAKGMLGSQVLFLTISLDPAHDTPADLSLLAGRIGADPDTWRFATGDPTEIKMFLGGELGFYYSEADAAGQIERDQEVLMIDGTGMLRARYQGAAPEVWRVMRDLELLRREAGSAGAMRSVYEASHLFLCYPD